jgi:hypothetical protein
MKNYTGKANTLDGAIRQAAQEAIADLGRSLVGFSLEEVRGVHGGFTGIPEIEVVITIPRDEQTPKCKEVLEYQAYQNEGAVTLVAFGQHPSDGYLVAFELSPIDIYPPQYILTHRAPTGPTAQVVTPFVVSAGFRDDSPVENVIVEDGNGKQKIPVKQIDVGGK